MKPKPKPIPKKTRPIRRGAPPVAAGKAYRFAGSQLPVPSWPATPADDTLTVVIPVLNESERIHDVVRFARRSKYVTDVIVVDDGSIDGTPELARAAGAHVITSAMLGKGASMEDGMLESQSSTILYLDGDLVGLREDLVERMFEPIVSGKADFVKASFSRRAGRVTVLTARPLLRTYFPELAQFEQPLGGIIAVRKDLLKKLRFENDYGVDVGLFLDSAALGARMAEVDIGHIEHDSHDLEVLGEMATQVARAIIERAEVYGRLRRSFLLQTKERERLLRANPEAIVAKIGAVERLALFDMDGTLLNGRFIIELARRTGREEKLAKYLDRHDLTPEYRTKRIARVFKGVPMETFVATARAIPLVPGAVEAVVGLRKLGYRVGIVTDSYHLVAEVARRRVFADFAISNVVEFSKGKSTGDVTLAPTMRSNKINALRFLTKRMGVSAKQILGVGDGINDIGMLRAAGISVAFQPKNERVRRAAQYVINGSLDELLKIVAARDGREP
jgi:glucosyl-3-phosphoglycerate synthase